jgi:RHS repeat-associated protein
VQAVVPGTNGGTTTFKYDPFGRRIQKSGPLGTTNYLYDGINDISEMDSSGTILAKYTGENEIDEPLAESRSGTTSYYEQDGMGSISSLSNATGALSNTYTYDSFGRLVASTGTLANPYQYTGREFDAETGLYFNRARYLDPTNGRWLSEDPIRFFGGHNFYGYVRNNPLKFRDPLGKQSQMPSCYPDCVHTQQEIDEMQREHDATMQRILGPDGSLPDPEPTPPPSPQKPSTCPCEHDANYYSVVAEVQSEYDLERLEIIGRMIGISWGLNNIEHHLARELWRDLTKGIDVYLIYTDIEDLEVLQRKAHEEIEKRLNCKD